MQTEAESSTALATHHPQASRRLDRKAVVRLKEKGLNNYDIAKHQGVEPSTVWRFMQRHKPNCEALQAFKRDRADIFARLQAKSHEVQERIIDSLDDGVVAALTPTQKSSLLYALNAQAGTIFDKERLERGQSTSNISWASRLVDTTIKQIHQSAQPIDSQALTASEKVMIPSQDHDLKRAGKRGVKSVSGAKGGTGVKVLSRS